MSVAFSSKAITEDHQKDATQRGEMGDDAINPNSLVVVDIQKCVP